jgi:hypothetical protein
MNLSKKIRVVAALGSLSAAVWAGTFATFTDDAASSSTFTAGTVDLELADDADDSYAFTSIEMSNMKPGDVKYAPLKVENAGTLAYLLDMSVSATNGDAKNLRDQLVAGAQVVANAAACDSAGAGYAAAAAVPVVNTVFAEGSLATRAVDDRAMAAGASQVWCFKVELPSSSGNAFQAATTTATLNFTATQS